MPPSQHLCSALLFDKIEHQDMFYSIVAESNCSVISLSSSPIAEHLRQQRSLKHSRWDVWETRQFTCSILNQTSMNLGYKATYVDWTKGSQWIYQRKPASEAAHSVLYMSSNLLQLVGRIPLQISLH